MNQNTIKNIEWIECILNLPILGVIPNIFKLMSKITHFVEYKKKRREIREENKYFYWKVDKGKLFERIGRKVMGLTHLKC